MSAKWKELITLGDKALDQGDPSQAEQHYREALSVAKQEFAPNDINLARTYQKYGFVNVFGLGIVLGADNFYNEALRVVESLDSSEAKSLRVYILYELGETYSRQGKTSESIPVLERALSLLAESNGRNVMTGHVAYSLGISYGVKQRFDDAIAMLAKASEIFEQHNVYEEQAVALADLASVLNYAGRSQEAEAVQRRADEIASRL